MHRWEYFKDDTDRLRTTAAGSERTHVLRSRAALSWPYSRLAGEPLRRAQVGRGRWTFYLRRGTRRFRAERTGRGIDTFGNLQNRQIVVTGNGDRPVINGDLNITLFPSSRLSLINETSVSNTRITGDNSYEQFNNATLSGSDAELSVSGRAADHERHGSALPLFPKVRCLGRIPLRRSRVRSIEDSAALGSPFSGLTGEQSDLLRAGIAALNWMPYRICACISRPRSDVTTIRSLRSACGITMDPVARGVPEETLFAQRQLSGELQQ